MGVNLGTFSCSSLLGTTLVLILLTDRVAYGIRCYECSSAWNDDCNRSPPPSRYLKLCSVPLCSKFYAEENGVARVERYCGGSDFANGCRDTSFPDRPPGTRYRAVSCRCNDRDGCNFGSKTRASVPMTMIVALLSLSQWIWSALKHFTF